MPGLGLDYKVNSFTGKRLVPQWPHRARKTSINIGPSQTLAYGTCLGLTVGKTNDVQTISISGTPTGGYFQLNWAPFGNTQTCYVAYNATATGTETGAGTTASPYVTVLGAMNAIDNSGSITVTGGGLPGTAVVVTFGGIFAGLPQPVLTVTSTGLTGGSSPTASVAHTTTGVSAGTYVPYSTSLLTAPSTAPTLTAASGTLAAAQITVGYTYVNSVGETTLSPLATIAADGSHKITISSITIPTGATGINYYVSDGGPLFYLTQLTTAAAQDITTTTLTGGNSNWQKFPPTENTTCPAVAILEYDVATDASGNAYFGQQTSSEWGQTSLAVPAYLSGDFNAADLTGLTAEFLRQIRGHQISGTFVNSGSITSGLVHIP